MSFKYSLLLATALVSGVTLSQDLRAKPSKVAQNKVASGDVRSDTPEGRLAKEVRDYLQTVHPKIKKIDADQKSAQELEAIFSNELKQVKNWKHKAHQSNIHTFDKGLNAYEQAFENLKEDFHNKAELEKQASKVKSYFDAAKTKALSAIETLKKAFAG